MFSSKPFDGTESVSSSSAVVETDLTNAVRNDVATEQSLLGGLSIASGKTFKIADTPLALSDLTNGNTVLTDLASIKSKVIGGGSNDKIASYNIDGDLVPSAKDVGNVVFKDDTVQQTLSGDLNLVSGKVFKIDGDAIQMSSLSNGASTLTRITDNEASLQYFSTDVSPTFFFEGRWRYFWYY